MTGFVRIVLAFALVALPPTHGASAQQQVADSNVPPPTVPVPVTTLAPATHVDVADLPPSLGNANLLLARGRYLAAIHMYERLLPTTADIQNHMGVASERMLMFDQAQRCFESAVQLDPKLSEAWNNLGTVFHARGDVGRAEKMYRKSIKLRAGNADAYQNLGALLYSKGKFSKGDAMYREAMRIDPGILERTAQRGIQTSAGKQNMAETHYHLACNFAQHGSHQIAMDYLRRSVLEGFRDRNRLLHETSFADLRTSEPFLKLVDDLKNN